MSVCQVCGVNVEIFDDHAPGCPEHVGTFNSTDELFEEKGDPKYKEAASEWLAVVTVASERGTKLAQSILRDSMFGALEVDDPQDIEILEEVMFDEHTMTIVDLCTWAGAMGMIQVLIEQELLDPKTVAEYLGFDTDGTI